MVRDHSLIERDVGVRTVDAGAHRLVHTVQVGVRLRRDSPTLFADDSADQIVRSLAARPIPELAPVMVTE